MEGPAGQDREAGGEMSAPFHSKGNDCSKAQNIGQKAGLKVAGIHQGRASFLHGSTRRGLWGKKSAQRAQLQALRPGER